MEDKYLGRGVSAQKTEVHAAIEGLSKGLYPTAFCKILPDLVAQNPAYANIMHGDTAGTKSSLAYIYWKETGDLSVWEGIAQDAIVMNLDDMACVGCTTDIVISSTIGRNAHLISGDVIKTIIQGAEKFYAMLADHDVQITSGGGETADVGDIVRTIDVGYTTFARMKREDLIVCDIQPGQKIIGFASYGQSSYEKEYNSGIGSNGLTSARHDVLSNIYAEKYPESFSPETSNDLIYSGSKLFSDNIDINGEEHTIGKLLTSPTRTFLPLLRAILKEHKKECESNYSLYRWRTNKGFKIHYFTSAYYQKKSTTYSPIIQSYTKGIGKFFSRNVPSV